MAQVRNKREMYPLYERGDFGNKLRTWASIDDFAASGFAGTVSLRYAGKGGGGWAAYDVEPNAVGNTVNGWVTEGASAALVKVNEGAPDSRLTIQGEVCDNPHLGGLVLRASTWRGKMRDAMKWADHFWNAEAALILRDYLTGASYDDIRALLDIYQGAVVEFSAYEMCLGDCRGRNALVWEVRHY